jgi:hypothetical protein
MRQKIRVFKKTRRKTRFLPIALGSYSLIAVLFLIIFIFQLVTLLFIGTIAIPRPSEQILLREDNGQRFALIGPALAVRGERATPADEAKYRKILAQEFARYGPQLMKQVNLKKIDLCCNLTVNGKPQGGLALGTERTIYLNLKSAVGPVDEQRFRRAFHHEIFHILDKTLEGKPGAAAAWTRLNPHGFSYGGDAILRALEDTNQDPDRRPETSGLLNYYSMVSPQEDRAELFSYLMVYPDELKALALEDRILRKKLERLKRELIRFSAEFEAMLKAKP